MPTVRSKADILSAAEKPAMPTVQHDAIPQSLREQRRWMGWSWKLKNGRWTKPPLNLNTGGNGDSTDPNVWCSYQQAAESGSPGLGFALGEGDGGWYAGVDLDDCRDPETGELTPLAQQVIAEMDSYTEASPSGTGVKILCHGTLPKGVRTKWVGELEPQLYDKLAEVGLLPPRSKFDQSGLKGFLDAYIARRSDVKGSTATVFGHTRRCLIQYFGADKHLADITEADADDWRRWLASDQQLAENTIRRRCAIARQFFRDAVRRRLISANPFGDMKGVGVKSNRSRDYFLSREDADCILAACPDSQWRVIFALSRFGGLRCPSEHLALKWSDVDWRRDD